MSEFAMSTHSCKFLHSSLALVLFSLAGGVFAQVYKCETESGAVLYQNMPGKACKAMDLPNANVIPAPRLPVSTSAPSARASSPAQTASVSPVSFPKVDGATQKARDNDRKRIIEDEWKKEKTRLGDLEKDFNGGQPERRADERNFTKYEERVGKMREEIQRTRANIDSLEREMRAVN
jgi:hypothetical protein